MLVLCFKSQNCYKPFEGIERNEKAPQGEKQYELIGLNDGIGKTSLNNKVSLENYTTYLKKSWNKKQRLVQPDLLISSSLDIDTLMDWDKTLKDKSSPKYAEKKQLLLDVFLEKYTLG